MKSLSAILNFAFPRLYVTWAIFFLNAHWLTSSSNHWFWWCVGIWNTFYFTLWLWFGTKRD